MLEIASVEKRKVGKAKRAHLIDAKSPSPGVRWWARRKSAFVHPTELSAENVSVSGPACRRDSRRSRAGSCGRASRPRHISPAGDTADIWSRGAPREGPA